MTPWEWHAELFGEARNRGLSIFSSPFDFAAVDFLEELDAPRFQDRIVRDSRPRVIAKAAATGKPLVISTGMATAEEIDKAVGVARLNGAGGLVLLHCNSTYPAEPGQMDLATIADMRARWSCPVGLSDHTLSHSSSIAAVALGAAVLEKHITMRRSDGGPDGAFSLESHEFAARCFGTRDRAGDWPRTLWTIAVRGRVVGVPSFVVRRRRRQGRRTLLCRQCSIDSPRRWSPPEVHRAGSRAACGGRCGTWHPARLVDGRWCRRGSVGLLELIDRTFLERSGQSDSLFVSAVQPGPACDPVILFAAV